MNANIPTDMGSGLEVFSRPICNWIITVAFSDPCLPSATFPYVVYNATLLQATQAALDQAQTEFPEYSKFTIVDKRLYEPQPPRVLEHMAEGASISDPPT